MKFKGYFFAALAAAAYGTNPIFAKPLYAAGMNPDSVLLFRYLLALILMGMIMLWRAMQETRKGEERAMQKAFGVGRHTLPQLILMGLLMSASSILLFMSYNFMPVGIASTLLFVYPIMVAVIMTLCFHERLSWLVVACLALASVGVAMLCKTDGSAEGLERDATTFMTGFALVMASSLSYAIYLVGLNKTRIRTIAPMSVTFYVLLFGLSIYLFRIAFGVPLVWPTTLPMWLNCLGLGLFPTVISLVFTSLAIQGIGSTQTALLGAFEPVTAVALGVLILGEHISLQEAIGMALIFIAVSLVVKRRG